MPIKKIKNDTWRLGVLLMILFLLLLLLLLAGCGKNTQLTDAEVAALNEIFGQAYSIQDYTNINDKAITNERKEKFKAVDKICTTPTGDYAFISKPVAYNGPINLAVGIDQESGTIVGMRIVEHMETPHYVRDMDRSWFTQRFAGKSADTYLELVSLAASQKNQIVAITGATVTTEGILNGVNACMGLFEEYVMNAEADRVPYMVKFEKEAGTGPMENGLIAIRAHGVVVGQVSLAEIRQMPSVKRTMSIHSTAGTSQHSFRGTLLSNLITAVDPTLLDKYEWVQPVGVDEYSSNIAMEEVLAENSVYVMYEDNGEPLNTKSGEPGAMRVVVLDDVFGQRFTNYMIEIVLE